MAAENERPQTLMEAVRYFDRERAEQYIRAIKWHGYGPACPRCGSTDVGEIKSRRRYQCREWLCRKQFSLTTGTIMESSHLRSDQWVVAVWLIVNAKNGISSCEVARSLGIKQQSAWHLLHRIRFILKQVAAEKMAGVIEADATFVGGLYKFMTHARRERARRSPLPRGKAVVHALKCRDTGTVRATTIDSESRTCTEPVIRENVAPGSRLFTDNGHAYRWARHTPDFAHAYVNHFMEYVRGAVHVNGLENFFNCLRRGLKGTYIRATPAHLGAYVDEQVYRFNTRKQTDWERFDEAMRKIVGKRLTYSELTDGATR